MSMIKSCILSHTFNQCIQAFQNTLNFYRPQTKFAKVIFLQVSVCPRGGGGRAWLHPGGGRAWDTTRYGDTINERVVRILLECILVRSTFFRLE